MTKRMNWRSAHLSGKRTVSVGDEAEYRSNDAASRWLERNEKKAKRKFHPPSQPVPSRAANSQTRLTTSPASSDTNSEVSQ